MNDTQKNRLKSQFLLLLYYLHTYTSQFYSECSFYISRKHYIFHTKSQNNVPQILRESKVVKKRSFFSLIFI